MNVRKQIVTELHRGEEPSTEYIYITMRPHNICGDHTWKSAAELRVQVCGNARCCLCNSQPYISVLHAKDFIGHQTES